MAERRYLKCVEAGADATVYFTIDDLEALEDEHGITWYADTLKAIDRFELKALRRLAELAVKSGDAALLVNSVPVATLAKYLLDALLLVVIGRTSDEPEAA